MGFDKSNVHTQPAVDDIISNARNERSKTLMQT